MLLASSKCNPGMRHAACFLWHARTPCARPGLKRCCRLAGVTTCWRGSPPPLQPPLGHCGGLLGHQHARHGRDDSARQGDRQDVHGDARRRPLPDPGAGSTMTCTSFRMLPRLPWNARMHAWLLPSPAPQGQLCGLSCPVRTLTPTATTTSPAFGPSPARPLTQTPPTPNPQPPGAPNRCTTCPGACPSS